MTTYNAARANLTYPRGVQVGNRLLAASSFKILRGSTYADLLSTAVKISKPVGNVVVMVVSDATLYGVYCSKTSAATTMYRIRMPAMGATTVQTVGKNQIGMFYMSATNGETLNFQLGNPFTPQGASGGHPRELLKQIIVWEES